MSLESFLADAFVYLAAAVVSVPVAKRLGLGSVLGYLLAGVAIGPFVLGLVGAEGQDVMHFAEFGVVMMLFLIGLELQPALLWRLRAPILGLGGLQVTLSTLAFTGIGMGLGFSWQEALAIGMTLALSSTAIVLQTLAEKGLMKTEAGQRSFSVLLFQDIAVIPMLAVLPLLAGHAGVGEAGGHGIESGHGTTTWIAGLPPWGVALAVLGAVTAIVLGGRYLLRPVFRVLGRTRMREVFTAAGLLLVIGIALLMMQVGLSPALGTFLAGVVLANSEYRHELESDIEPFKGLLLGLFFIAVGASIDFGLIASEPQLIVGLTVGLLVVKFAILFLLSRMFRMGTDQGFLFAFGLAEAGEFAFVLLSFALQEGVLNRGTVDPLVASVALSMTLAPLLLLFNDRIVRPLVGTRVEESGEADEIHDENPVLIAGFGSFGSTVGRLLNARGVGTTVLDVDSDRVELLRNLGLKVYYGDATRHDLLETAGAANARLLVVAVDSPERTLRVVETARKNFPGLTILARAFDWDDAHDLMEAGAEHVYRDTLDTALRTGTDALQLLEYRSYEAFRASRTFLHHEEESLRMLAEHRKEGRSVFLSAARQRIRDLEDILRADLEHEELERDAGWDPDSLREEYGEGPPPGDPS
jgi:CPA2 family monovalent cation:H+ antiporter-2